VNAPAARESLKGSAEQPGVRNDFGHDVNKRPNPSQEQDDKDPVRVRAAADKVHNRHCLQHKSPSVQEKEK
jgi:hypothetical protein